ncbi:MAG TPA: hypothetical protein VMU52_01285 [Steroidobacteraceae bacterium]|nr:hypothetical protein [Steroidobacteraceae bacterium]
MRPSMPLLISAVLAVAPLARAQTAAAPSTTAASAAASGTIVREPTEAAQTQQAAGTPSASAGSGAIVREPTAERAKPRSLHKHRAKQARATATAHASAPAGASDGVLSLGATDITGNKELPKVMVIVPWKDSLGAGGVIKPTDSLMDEVLQPVDRGVFQRRIRYYGQLDAAGQPAAANQVAPVGDRH